MIVSAEFLKMKPDATEEYAEEQHNLRGEILRSNDWSHGEKAVIMWQFGLSSHFKKALFDCIVRADDKNLEKLRLGFPAEVHGFWMWSRGNLAIRLRATGLDI